MTSGARLFSIKVIHTLIWTFFVMAIGYILYAGIVDAIGWEVWVAIGLVLIEGIVILLNEGKCPLTPIAARWTDAREDNFDIFLPLWLARYNKQIFTSIFSLGVFLVLYRIIT
jgi:hypothetical protein